MTWLEPEQVELLRDMAEAARNAERTERSFYLTRVMAPHALLRGPNRFGRQVPPHDVDDLHAAGLLILRSRGRSTSEYSVAPAAYEYLQDAAQRAPVAQVEEDVMRYIDGDAIQSKYPLACGRWQEAATLLWREDAARELTTIGHKLREATQEFATALVERHSPADVDPDPAHTVSRLRSVIDLHRDQLGEARHDLLSALVQYWGEVSDLLQRQEHGGQKEGEPLNWEDGRRAVFQTVIVMYEVDRTL